MSEYVRPEYTPLFRETQGIIADYLNSDPQISSKGIEFFPEAKLDIDFEVKKALGQQGIVGVVNTLKGTFAGHDGCTNAWQIEAEVDVIENPPVRRGQLKKMGLSTGTVSDILDWVQESLGGPSSPTFAKFNPVSQEIGQNNGLVVGRSIMRTLVLADTSAVISTENQWVCPYALRPELYELSSQVQEIEYDISSKVDLSALDNYLPISGGIMYGTIEFSPDTDWEHDLGYKLIQLNPTGEYWQALFGVEDDNGQPYVAHNGSETGSGAFGQYTWKLWFPDENGTLATKEWAYGELSGKVDVNDLSDYLPLSGGVLTGDLGLQKMYVGIRPLIHNLGFDGFGHITHSVKAAVGPEVVYDTLTFPMTNDGENKTIATQEWTQGEISGKAEISALSDYLPLSGGTLSGTLNTQSIYGNQFTSNSDCQTGGGQTYTSFGNNGILMGRSPDILRILWPFNTSLGNNQTFATQEWTNGELSAYPQSNEISATRVETMTTIHESDWAGISAQASSSTLYIVIPD